MNKNPDVAIVFLQTTDAKWTWLQSAIQLDLDRVTHLDHRSFPSFIRLKARHPIGIRGLI